VKDGLARFERYFRRKGWFGFQQESTDDTIGSEHIIRDADLQMATRTEGQTTGDRGGRILLEFATAYAITKLLLPIRIMFSVWATPWFAKSVIGRFAGLRKSFRTRQPSRTPGKR